MYIIIKNSKVTMSMSNTDFKEIWCEDSLIRKGIKHTFYRLNRHRGAACKASLKLKLVKGLYKKYTGQSIIESHVKNPLGRVGL